MVAGCISILWSRPSRVALKSQFFSEKMSPSFPRRECPSMGGAFPDQTHFSQASGKPTKQLIWTIGTSSDLWALEVCGAKARRAVQTASVLPIYLQAVEGGV